MFFLVIVVFVGSGFAKSWPMSAVGDVWSTYLFVLGPLGTSSMGKAGQVGQGAVGKAQGRAGPLPSGLLVGRECNFPFVSTAS